MMLIKVIILLPSDLLSDKCKDFMIQELRPNTNLKKLDDIMPHLHAFQIDEVAKKVTSKRDKLYTVKEEVDGRVCRKSITRANVLIDATTVA